MYKIIDLKKIREITNNDIFSFYKGWTNELQNECTCGHSWMGYSEECPKCSKKITERIRIYNSGQFIPLLKLNPEKNGFSIVLEEYFISFNSKEELEVKLLNSKAIYKIIDDKYEPINIHPGDFKDSFSYLYSSSFRVFNGKKIINEILFLLSKNNNSKNVSIDDIKTIYPGFEECNLKNNLFTDRFFWAKGDNKDTVNYLEYERIKTLAPIFTEDEHIHEPLLSKLPEMNEVLMKLNYSSFEAFMKKYYIQEEYLLNNENYLKDFEQISNFNLNNFKGIHDDLKSLVLNFGKHYEVPLSESLELGVLLNRSIDYKDFDIFFKYFKDNYIVDKNNILNNYLKDIEVIKKNSLKITNFNLKNARLFRNNEVLQTQYNYPEENISIFLDKFNDNPIEAMKLIKSKKKFTKKQIEELVD